MKKIIYITGITCMVCLAFMLTASTLQQGKGKGKGNQQGNEKAVQQKGNHGQKEVKQNNNGHNSNNGQTEKMKGNGNANADHSNQNDNAKGKNNDHGNNGKMKGNDANNDNGNGKGKNKGADYYKNISGYHWDKDNFYDRKNYKHQDKVTICHKISKGNGEGVEITVSENAVKAHLNHGDIIGQCPVYQRQYSDIFYRDRQDYYNTLQGTQEQVSYSQSILDYALARLAYGKGELVTLQNNNAPLSVIQGRQQSVNQLQQNVSLLQTLIGVAVSVVANKLQ